MQTSRQAWVIGVVIAGVSFSAWAQSPLPGSNKEYHFTGRLSATNLVNVVGPERVVVRVYLVQEGKVRGVSGPLRLRPVDTGNDTWTGNFCLTATLPEGAYVYLVAASSAFYPGGAVTPLQGSTVILTGFDNAVDAGILPLIRRQFAGAEVIRFHSGAKSSS